MFFTCELKPQKRVVIISQENLFLLTKLRNLNCVFRTGGLQGKVIVNGKSRILEDFRRISCYIQQDDRIQPLLTVQENMSLAADLKLGPKVPRARKDATVRTMPGSR